MCQPKSVGSFVSHQLPIRRPPLLCGGACRGREGRWGYIAWLCAGGGRYGEVLSLGLPRTGADPERCNGAWLKGCSEICSVDLKTHCVPAVVAEVNISLWNGENCLAAVMHQLFA